MLLILLSSTVINTVVVTKSAQAGQCKIWFQGWRTYGRYGQIDYPGTGGKRYENPEGVLNHWLAWLKTARPYYTNVQQDGPVHGDPASYSNAVYYYISYTANGKDWKHPWPTNEHNTAFAWKQMEYNGTFYDMNYFRIHLLERGRANCDTIPPEPDPDPEPEPEPEVTYTISISSIISPPYKNYITSMDPSLTKGFVAEVKGSDGKPGNIPVDWIVKAIEDTGGHVQTHHSARNPTHSGVLEIGSKKGTSLKNITINGEQEFKFTSPKSSGDYSVEITCPNHTCTQTKPDKIWVGIKDLKSLPASPLYNFIGDTDAHPDNHYVSELAAKKIDNIAFVYNEDFPDDDVLHINDASLERGGLFDITGEWKPAHKTHNKGTDIDIRANEFVGETPGDVLKRNYKDFYRISKRHGCLAVREFADQPKEHFHLYCNEKYGKAE